MTLNVDSIAASDYKRNMFFNICFSYKYKYSLILFIDCWDGIHMCKIYIFLWFLITIPDITSFWLELCFFFSLMITLFFVPKNWQLCWNTLKCIFLSFHHHRSYFQLLFWTMMHNTYDLCYDLCRKNSQFWIFNLHKKLVKMR